MACFFVPAVALYLSGDLSAAVISTASIREVRIVGIGIAEPLVDALQESAL